MELLDRAAVTFQIVLTKADDMKPVGLEARQREATALARAHAAAYPAVLVTSSRSGLGVAETRAAIAGAV